MCHGWHAMARHCQSRQLVVYDCHISNASPPQPIVVSSLRNTLVSSLSCTSLVWEESDLPTGPVVVNLVSNMTLLCKGLVLDPCRLRSLAPRCVKYDLCIWVGTIAQAFRPTYGWTKANCPVLDRLSSRVCIDHGWDHMTKFVFKMNSIRICISYEKIQ